MNVNFFVGVDIESIARFRGVQRLDDKNFLKKIFSDRELVYAFSKVEPAEHLAARFAGKEAVLKALMSAGENPVPHHHIEILNDEQNVPYISIESTAHTKRSYAFRISLSHAGGYALSFVIMSAEDFVDADSAL